MWIPAYGEFCVTCLTACHSERSEESKMICRRVMGLSATKRVLESKDFSHFATLRSDEGCHPQDENGYAPLGDEFGCQWCREPGSEYDTGDRHHLLSPQTAGSTCSNVSFGEPIGSLVGGLSMEVVVVDWTSISGLVACVITPEGTRRFGPRMTIGWVR